MSNTSSPRQLSYSSEELLIHVFHIVLGMKKENISSLTDIDIYSLSRFRDLELLDLEEYKREGVLSDGNFKQLKLFYQYLHVYKPTPQQLISMTEDDWFKINKAQLRANYDQDNVSISLPQPPTQPTGSASSTSSTDNNSSNNNAASAQEQTKEAPSPLPNPKRQRVDTGNNININSIEKSIKPHNQIVTSLKTFKKSSSNYLVSGSWDEKIIVTDLTDEDNSKTVLSSSDQVWDIITFEMHGKHYVATCEEKDDIDIWSLHTKEIEYALKGHSDNINQLILYENRNSRLFIISSSHDKTIKIWDLTSYSCVASLEGHSSRVHALALYKKDNQSFLATCSWDGYIKLWDLTSNTFISTLVEHSDWVWAITVFYNDIIPFLVSGVCTIKVWNLSNNKLENTLKGHTGDVTSLKILMIEDKSYLASGSRDETIIIWDLSNFTEVKTLKASSGVGSLETFEDDKKNKSYLASGHGDGTISLWAY